MKESTYEYLWENALERAIRDVLDSIPEETRQEYGFSYQDELEDKKKQILEEYDIQRLNVRTKYFDTGENDEKLIDVHKVCACFIVAVMKTKIFRYTNTTPMRLEIFCSNYTVAFLAGIHIMYLCLLSDFAEMEDKSLFNLLKEQAALVFPETNKGHDKYLYGRVKTLALNDIYEVDFDILTYADMMFWIDKYNQDLLYQKLKTGEVKNLMLQE